MPSATAKKPNGSNVSPGPGGTVASAKTQSSFSMRACPVWRRRVARNHGTRPAPAGGRAGLDAGGSGSNGAVARPAKVASVEASSSRRVRHALPSLAERIQLVVQRADIDPTIVDGRTAGDRAARGELPAQFALPLLQTVDVLSTAPK